MNIGELPSDDDLRQSVRPSSGAPMTRNVLQLSVKPLDDETRSALNIDRGGVLVDEIVADGPADRAGIVEGDVISMVDNKPVDSARDLGNVLQDMGDRRNVAVLVHRAEGPVFLALQIEK